MTVAAPLHQLEPTNCGDFRSAPIWGNPRIGIELAPPEADAFGASLMPEGPRDRDCQMFLASEVNCSFKR